MNKKLIWVLGAVTILLVIVFFYAKTALGIESINWGWFIGQREAEEVSCTQEAMLCPDGSAVGRVGPSCDFAPCPTPSAGSDMPGLVSVESPMTTTLSKAAKTLGVTVTPLKIVEDSRCPIDVQCIQAGTVRVEATIKEGSAAEKTVTFILGTAVKISDGSVTLSDASPAPQSKTTITPEQYQLTFTITKP